MSLIDKYLTYIKGVRRYSGRTLEVYAGVLGDFAAFVEAGDDRSLLSMLKPVHLRNYEVSLMEDRKLKPTTVNLSLSVLSGFCKYLVKTGALDSNPVRIVTRPRTEKRLPVVFRADALDEYLESTKGVPEFGTYAQKLSRVIISTLYCTGIRRSELIGLKRSSVDFSRRVMKVRGKGDKMREIPLVPSLCEEISLYLQSADGTVGVQQTPDAPLFITEKGSALYPVFVDRVIKGELGRIDGITGRRSPHVFRHTLATELLSDGTDINSIKELLGHSSLAATQVYTHTSVERLKNVYKQAHPRAKSGGKNGDQD